MAVTFIQSNTQSNGTVASISSTLNGVAAGNLLVATFSCGGTTISDINIADNNGNVWNIAASTVNGGNVHVIAYATGVNAGNTTVTLTNSSAVFMIIQLSEYNSGIAGRNLGLDQFAFASGTGTSLNSGNVTTTSNNEALVGLIQVGGTLTAGSGFTLFSGINPVGEYQVVSSTGTYAATGTTSVSGPWTAIIATFLVSPFPIFNVSVGRFNSLGKLVGNLIAPFWALSNVTPVTVNANSTSDQNLMSIVVPANTLNSVGRTLELSAKGVYTTPGGSTATVTIKIKLGSLTLLTIVTTANAGGITNNSFLIESCITTQTGGASAAFEASGKLMIDLGATTATACSVFADTNAAAVSSVDITADQILQVTISFSAGSTSNTATQRQLVLQTTN